MVTNTVEVDGCVVVCIFTGSVVADDGAATTVFTVLLTVTATDGALRHIQRQLLVTYMHCYKLTFYL